MKVYIEYLDTSYGCIHFEGNASDCNLCGTNQLQYVPNCSYIIRKKTTQGKVRLTKNGKLVVEQIVAEASPRLALTERGLSRKTSHTSAYQKRESVSVFPL